MKKKKKEEMSLHDKAVRLSEGGVVWHNGHELRARIYEGTEYSCWQCTLDCICHGDIADLCAEVDEYDGKKHFLELTCNEFEKKET